MFLLDHQGCKAEAAARFEKMNDEFPRADLRAVIYKGGMDVGNSETFRSMLRVSLYIQNRTTATYFSNLLQTEN